VALVEHTSERLSAAALVAAHHNPTSLKAWPPGVTATQGFFIDRQGSAFHSEFVSVDLEVVLDFLYRLWARPLAPYSRACLPKGTQASKRWGKKPKN
jgi:hypothetical protein